MGMGLSLEYPEGVLAKYHIALLTSSYRMFKFLKVPNYIGKVNKKIGDIRSKS